jgi:putative hemolysin
MALLALTNSLVEITPAPAANPSKLAAQARRYCRRQGGEVQTRVPTFGTNNPESELPLNGTRQFCKFTSPTDGTHIFVGLDTLAARQPTLATLAYLTRPQVGNIPPDVNPASIYCSGLGGTDLFGGMNVVGGGWVEEHDKDVPVLQACVFPDQSVIDSFGIFYHANGIVRGVDLTSSFAYQSTNPPFVFGN